MVQHMGRYDEKQSSADQKPNSKQFSFLIFRAQTTLPKSESPFLSYVLFRERWSPYVPVTMLTEKASSQSSSMPPSSDPL